MGCDTETFLRMAGLEAKMTTTTSVAWLESLSMVRLQKVPARGGSCYQQVLLVGFLQR